MNKIIGISEALHKVSCNKKTEVAALVKGSGARWAKVIFLWADASFLANIVLEGGIYCILLYPPMIELPASPSSNTKIQNHHELTTMMYSQSQNFMIDACFISRRNFSIQVYSEILFFFVSHFIISCFPPHH